MIMFRFCMKILALQTNRVVHATRLLNVPIFTLRCRWEIISISKPVKRFCLSPHYFIGGMMPKPSNPLQQSTRVIEIRPYRDGEDAIPSTRDAHALQELQIRNASCAVWMRKVSTRSN